MNERMFELIQLQNGNRGLLWTEEDKQEFTELIIKKCVEVVENSPWLLPRGYKAKDQAELVKQHFGVEE